MKIKNLLLLTTFCAPMLHAVIQVNLTAPVNCKVFDRSYETLYLGLAGGGTNAISAFPRYDGSGTPAATALATNSILSGATIEFLALSEQGCSATSLLASVTLAATGALQETFVCALTSNGATVTNSAALNDASGAVTAGIVGLAASEGNVFAAVRVNGGDFGAADSGIALMELTPSTAILTTLDATTGLAGNKAQEFDTTSVTLRIGAAPVTFDAPVNENIHLCWDSFLGRLYLATQITAGIGGARSVAVGYVDDHGILQINQIAPGAAFNNTNNQIIGTTNATTVHAYQVRVMHASTGPSYLIVNGNTNIATNGENSIYALPLVDNASVPATHGTLANKNSALTDGKFTIAAALPAELALISDDFAKVGAGPLPMPNNTAPYDIVVAGDTVYASIDDPLSATSDSGIFYSQAMFDQTGKLARWTPWTKRGTPFDSFPDGTVTQHPQVSFFDVDAMNGKLWAINYDNTTSLPGSKLMTTAWDLGSTTTSLATTLNAAMTSGCYSILDLDQSTRGLGTSSPGRYALFGGINQVTFALTSLSTAGAAPYDYNGTIPYPQTVNTNFSLATNFLSTALPAGAGAVVALEYSRRLNGDGAQNYFFAGAQGGLYVFADANTRAGFTVANTVNGLNAAPFSTGAWYQIDTDLIEGSVIALKTTGQGGLGALYILTLEATDNPTTPLISRLYSMIYDTTVDLMNQVSHIKLLAQSQIAATNSDLTDAKIILGMQNITQSNTDEQLVIATNHGLYRSRATEGVGSYGIIGAANQADALWTPVDSTDTSMYNGLFGIDNTLYQSTMWALQVADEAGFKTYARSSVRQFSGVLTANGYNFVPNPFNSSDTSASNSATLPQATQFWSDGNRRFFIMHRNGDTQGRNRLMVFPYDQDDWCASTLYLLDPIFNNICSCNCIKQIGATGILMVGTNSGVVALE